MSDYIHTGEIIPLMSWKEGLYNNTVRRGWMSSKSNKGKAVIAMFLTVVDESEVASFDPNEFLRSMGWEYVGIKPKKKRAKSKMKLDAARSKLGNKG